MSAEQSLRLTETAEGPLLRVAGIDGCRAGWLVAEAHLSNAGLRLAEVFRVSRFENLLISLPRDAVIAVDMPIGLAERGRRAADLAARRLLGPGRASSVFPAPVRAALTCDSYPAACDASAAASGKKLSRQSFAILPRIRELDGAMTPALQRRVFEVHPELAFQAMNGGQALVSKHRAAGVAHRAALLAGVFGPEVRDLRPPPGARLDDLYDACACAWSAARIATGRAQRLPAAPEVDARGLRMEILF